MNCPDCKQIVIPHQVQEHGPNATRMMDVVELCAVHALNERLAEAFRRYVTDDDQYHYNGDEQLLAEYDAAMKARKA